MEKNNHLKILKKAQELLKPIVFNNINSAIYLRHLRCSYGYLLDAIKSLEKKHNQKCRECGKIIGWKKPNKSGLSAYHCMRDHKQRKRKKEENEN